MEKPEIIAGIKQAIERGYSLEQAKKSFLNAGYNPKDVEDSSRALGGISTKIPTIPQFSTTTSIIQQNQIITREKPKRRWLIILVIILALLFLALLGVLSGLIFYPDKTKEIITRILPFLKI